jgi:SpoIID/LytB domain protein
MKAIISAVVFLTLTSLSAAEINDGRLYLEMMLTQGKQISVKICQDGIVDVREVPPPMIKAYSGNFTIEPYDQDSEIRWGIINRTEPMDSSASDDNDYQIRRKFVWVNGRLTIQYEQLIFEEKYFNTREEAEKYASETGYPLKQIQAIPMQNARIKVTDSKGKIDYFQLPVQLSTLDSISINGIDCNSHLRYFNIKQVNGNLVVTYNVNIEDYLLNVLPYEIGDEAPLEALKAQAVAARTHAISLLLMNRHWGDGYDLCNTTHCQVYKLVTPDTKNVSDAVHQTFRVVMIYDSLIADGVYHSNCGGRTENNQNAWSGKPIPYLQGVACHPEADSLDLSTETNAINWIRNKSITDGMASWEKRSEYWERTLSKLKLEQNTGVRELLSLTVLHRGVSGRILKLKLTGKNEVILEGEYKIRQVFGGLPSSFFYIQNGTKTSTSVYSLSEQIIISGKGFGHGVGMCQVGALQKARSGWNWQDILSHYYPGVTYSTDWLDVNVPSTNQE